MDKSSSETPQVSAETADSTVSASRAPQRRGKRAAHKADLGREREENTSRGSQEESCARRKWLNPPEKGPCKLRGSVSSASFLRKLREIVDSDRFQSIWWSDDGNIIVIEENLFKSEVLGRKGLLRVFNIINMINFIQQLHLHKFFITECDLPASASRAKLSVAGAMPASGELLCYYSPYFQRDYPHLQWKFKRSIVIRRRVPAAFPPELDVKEDHLSSSPKRQPGPAASAGSEPCGSSQEAAPAASAAPAFHAASPEPNGPPPPEPNGPPPPEPNGPPPPWLGPDSGAGGDGVGRQHNLCYRQYR
ncbi:heat shock transcription factor, Y-linked-like [Cyrtonyx montezumae]|uniref:heat shock transcription factor, Y-linked-like n=1 Tax=Cyrtonyx montezumae TaxID=9017 RepID=UPI0032DBB3A0